MDGILLALMPLLGFVAGTIGALIGAGGGFIAVPAPETKTVFPSSLM